MTTQNDSTLSAITLDELPSLDEIRSQIDPRNWNVLKPVIQHLPLLTVLNEIMNLVPGREEKEKRALFDLARLAIAKHEYTKRLYSDIIVAVTSDTDLAGNLTKEDVPLTLEMLSLMAELFALNQIYEHGFQTFRIAEAITDRFQLNSNKGIVFHQLGEYELRHGEFAEADTAFQKAARIFAPIAPDLEKRSNYQRALVYKFRLASETNPPEPDDIETIIAADHKARELVLLARARKAIDKDDFATAQTLFDELEERDSLGEVSVDRLITEARLARRTGEFEKAELLLKQAVKAAEGFWSDEITWEQFYLARDLGHVEESNAILERLKDKSAAVRIDYQQAMLAYNAGDNETAERLLRKCLQQTHKDNVRADCMGMLALITENPSEGPRFMHQAIGLYVKLNRRLDHAISLSHLATLEIGKALLKQRDGWPTEGLSEFRRADNLFLHAEQMAESLGASSFLLDLLMERARSEVMRRRYNVALRHFSKAATAVELTYLTMTDRKSANQYLSTHTGFYGLAINCALSAGKENAALLFSERGKARRFLRDAGERAYEDGYSSHSLSAKERDLLSVIQPIRDRLIQQRPLALQERQSLYDAEQQLRSLWREMRNSPELRTSLSHRVHQPLDVEILRQIVFGEPPGKVEDVAEGDEQVAELPGGGVMQCERCFVFNRIASTFCSACDNLLPKSASINANLSTGTASESELKRAFADELYDQGVELFQAGKIDEAEPYFQNAMTYAKHPDYSFFYALCRLMAGDSSAALRSLDEVLEQQYAVEYPFWPLPVSQTHFHNCVEALKHNQENTTEAFECLMNAYVDYSEKRRAERRQAQG
ncbi:MAG TPA: hypothetical protein VKB05_05055 [Pyrinomonadaceae bacterium]|nr:hypothetical protein [Pyrinomonadaceae bacterium]